MKQFRIVYRASNGVGQVSYVAFVDAKDEEGARTFFSKAFPRSEIASVTLEPVDPCAQYERRPQVS